MNKNHLKEFDVFLIILIVSILVLSLPHITWLLGKNTLLKGQEPYYHARIAEEIMKEGIPKKDSFAYNRLYVFNLYHLILALFSYIFTLTLASKIIPFLFGVLSVILFYLILKEFKLGLNYRLAIILIFIISPVFIYTFTISNPLAALIFLDLLGFFLLLKEKNLYFIIAVFIFALTLFFNLINALITLMLLLAFIFIKPKKLNYNRIISLLIGLTALLIIYYLPIYLKCGINLLKPSLIYKGFIKSLVSDLGSNSFSLFALLLAIMGLIVTWRAKYKFFIGYLVIFILFMLLPYYDVAIYLSFAVSLLAGVSFIALFKMKWTLKQIKNLTLLVLLLGFLFSTISYMDRIADLPPDKDMVNGLKWLDKRAGAGDVVFSHYSRGFWIEQIAYQPVVMDGSISCTDQKPLLEDSNEIFYSRNLKRTKFLLDKYHVSYIFIDKEMKNSLVWVKEDQGLLFLFRNKEVFKKVYGDNGVEVWLYLSDKAEESE